MLIATSFVRIPTLPGWLPAYKYRPLRESSYPSFGTTMEKLRSTNYLIPLSHLLLTPEQTASLQQRTLGPQLKSTRNNRTSHKSFSSRLTAVSIKPIRRGRELLKKSLLRLFKVVHE